MSDLLKRFGLEDRILGSVNDMERVIKTDFDYDRVKMQIELEKRSIEEAVRGNTQLREPAKAHDGRLEFLNTYPKKGVVVAIRKSGISKEIIIYGVKTFIKRVRRYIKKILK